MEAKELRCGNLYNHNGEIREVTPSTIEEVWDAPRSWCKPIPLTEEWLERFGAIVFDFDNGQPNQYRIGERLYVIREGKIADYGCSVILNYVHKLQNLYFALTGTELELKD